MGAVRLVFRAELRRRWRSWLAIALLVALVGGFVLAATAAGRRTDSAYPRFLARYGFDAVTLSPRTLVPQVARLPEVASASEDPALLNGQPSVPAQQPSTRRSLRGRCRAARRVAAVDLEARLRPVARPVIHGPGPGLVTLQRDYDVNIGTVITVPFYDVSQIQAVFSATAQRPETARGPTVAFHVVGIEASEGEFPSGDTPSYNLYAIADVRPHRGHADRAMSTSTSSTSVTAEPTSPDSTPTSTR